jgi:hypothetical protein
MRSSGPLRFTLMAIPVPLEISILLPELKIRKKQYRKYKELADIKEIVRITTIDKDQIREYFKKYGLEAYYHKIL